MRRSPSTVFAGLLMALLSPSTAWAQLSGNNLISLDGQLEHHFVQTGDYVGLAQDPDGRVEGVYREGPGVCWLTGNDGTRQNGDVLIYVGEVQCCIQSEQISDKLAFTSLWVQGTGPAYRMCKSQVFRQSK